MNFNRISSELLEQTEDTRIWFYDHWVDIPSRFRFGASIPKLVRPIIGRPTDSQYVEASRGHDWLYWTESHGTRKQFDTWMYYTLRQSGVSYIKANLMYTSVRLAGWHYIKWDDQDRAEAIRLYNVLKDRPDANKFLSQFKVQPWNTSI